MLWTSNEIIGEILSTTSDSIVQIRTVVAPCPSLAQIVTVVWCVLSLGHRDVSLPRWVFYSWIPSGCRPST